MWILLFIFLFLLWGYFKPEEEQEESNTGYFGYDYTKHKRPNQRPRWNHEFGKPGFTEDDDEEDE